MPQVKWLPEAVSDLERLHAFLKEKNADAAGRAARTILNGAELLKGAPSVGRPMADGTGRRQLFLLFAGGAYVLRYCIDTSGAVVIIRVWHSREDREAEDG